MKSDLATKIAAGAFNGSKLAQGEFSITDKVTTESGDSAGNTSVVLFGSDKGFRLDGCELIPESVRVRTGGASGTISYAGKLQRKVIGGSAVDITGSITLNRTVQTATAAAVTPLTPLARNEQVLLLLTAATTHVVGVEWVIEATFRRSQQGV